MPPVPAAKSDKVAELALSCCKTLLERCPPPDRERVLELLHRIGAVAALKREAAAEEVIQNHPLLTGRVHVSIYTDKCHLDLYKSNVNE